MNDKFNEITQQQKLWRRHLASVEADAANDAELAAQLDGIRRAALAAAATSQTTPARPLRAIAASVLLAAAALPLLMTTLQQPQQPSAGASVLSIDSRALEANPLALYGELDHYQWLVLGE